LLASSEEEVDVKQVRERVAGLDVHRDSVTACARVPDGAGGVAVAKETFGTTVKEVHRLAAWLADFEVTTVAMEATGVYWKPVFYPLEGLFAEVWLVNAHHIKNVPGRKTDMADAEWIADVVAHGMVRPSLVPKAEARELRELSRYRKTQIDTRAKEIQRLEKVLQDAGIKLTSVVSKTLGTSTRNMIEALIAGERDPEVLADMAQSRMRSKIDRLRDALPGWFGPHHAVLARRILDHIDFLQDTIAKLDAEVVARLDPFAEAIALLKTIPGVDQRTAEVIIAETGGDMSRFPTAGHLAAWAGVAPASHESAGKRHPAGTRHGARWLRRTLTEASRSAARSKGTYLSAQYSRLASRRGPNKAAVAVAHSILVSAWWMLTTNEPYRELGADYFRARLDPQRETRRLVARLEALGHEVTLTSVTAA
jgi:transposase